jgi:hypothetical protein
LAHGSKTIIIPHRLTPLFLVVQIIKQIIIAGRYSKSEARRYFHCKTSKLSHVKNPSTNASQTKQQ